MWVAPPAGSNDTLDAVMRCYDPVTKVLTDEMLVTKCNDVTVRTWSILYAGRGGRGAALDI